LNSLGFGILRRYVEGQVKAGYLTGLPDVRGWTDGLKTWKILRNEFSRQEVKDYGKDVVFLVGKAKSFGIVPAELENATGGDTEYRSANGMTDTDKTWTDLLTHFNQNVDPVALPTVIRMVRQTLVASIKMLDLVDFDDQKYLPVVMFPNGKPMAAKKYATIIIDEVQDVNPVDILLIKLSLMPNGIVMGVGDNNQSIYGFRGASVDAVERFSEAFGCIALPLSISYRCAKSIIAAARNIYPVIEAADGAPEGEVIELGNYTHSEFSARNEDMVVCRNNAPLINFAFKLIRRRVPTFVKGRDIGKGLLTLVENLDPDSVRDLNSKLNIWFAHQTEILRENDPDNEDAMQRLEDRYATLQVFIGENSDNRIDSLVNDIETVCSVKGNDKSDRAAMKGKVVLSTIHKAKGLEADTVFILDSFLLYKMSGSEGSWTHTQEQNLEYVAITRAKNRLVYITSKGFKD
jgi:superfamily I DNA/RNA helicase